MEKIIARYRSDIYHLLEGRDGIAKYFRRFEEDDDIETLQMLANNFTTKRLNYNDHGRVHAYIVTHNSIKILNVLEEQGYKPNIVKEGIGSHDDALLSIMVAAFLHDIGNAIHRGRHGTHSEILAYPFLMKHLYDHPNKWTIITTTLEAIYAHNDDKAISLEASIVKVADGTDMTKGRARIPYRLGKFDSHLVSALSIDRVEIEKGEKRPLRIAVEMEHTAGVFQVEYVLGKKVKESSLKGMVEVVIHVPSIGERIMYF